MWANNVQGNGNDSKARNSSKYLVYNDIVWRDPAGEHKEAQELRNEAY